MQKLDTGGIDNNIRKGIEPDYNNERVFNTKIPIIIAQSINGTMCHDNGKFEIYGKTEDNIIENINNVNVFYQFLLSLVFAVYLQKIKILNLVAQQQTNLVYKKYLLKNK